MERFVQRYVVGQSVEVFGTGPGLIGSFQKAEVIGVNGLRHYYKVRYRHIREPHNGAQLEETLPFGSIRPTPPPHNRHCFYENDHVEVWDKNAWWSGTVKNVRGVGQYEVMFGTFGYPDMTVPLDRIRPHLFWTGMNWRIVSQDHGDE